MSARKEGKIFSKWVGQQGQRDRQPTDNEKLSHFKIFNPGRMGQNLIYAHEERKKKKEKLTCDIGKRRRVAISKVYLVIAVHKRRRETKWQT